MPLAGRPSWTVFQYMFVRPVAVAERQPTQVDLLDAPHRVGPVAMGADAVEYLLAGGDHFGRRGRRQRRNVEFSRPVARGLARIARARLTSRRLARRGRGRRRRGRLGLRGDDGGLLDRCTRVGGDARRRGLRSGPVLVSSTPDASRRNARRRSALAPAASGIKSGHSCWRRASKEHPGQRHFLRAGVDALPRASYILSSCSPEPPDRRLSKGLSPRRRRRLADLPAPTATANRHGLSQKTGCRR